MINKVILLGNVGQDPEVKTVNDSKVATLSLATTEKWKDRNGESHEETEWHNIVAWRGLADVIEKYVNKGTKMYVEGKIKTRKYESDGKTQWRTEIIANKIVLL